MLSTMKYRNASHVLPDELLLEIQKYTQGELIYIPKIDEKKRWGEGSGARKFYEERNSKIGKEYEAGKTVRELSDEYALSEDRIMRIISQRTKRGKR